MAEAGDPWGDDALRVTLSGYRGVGTDADLPRSTRFLSSVAALIRKRLAEGEDASKPPAVFFLQPRPPASLGDVQRFPFLDNGREHVCGRFWFTSHAANDGRASEINPEVDDAEIFRLAVEDFGVGGVPAIILDARGEQPEVRYYPDGLAETSTGYLIRFDFSDISIDDIFAVIDGLHVDTLCTPEGQGRAGKLWADSSQGRPASNAEDQVQILLKAALKARYPTCTVRVEQTQSSGRLDLELEESLPDDRSKFERHALLELKVLRSRGSRGTAYSRQYTDAWIEKGVRQAAAYRIERGTKVSALCCFDMRDHVHGEECFDHVRELAARLEVTLGCWHVFNSSEMLREHVTRKVVGE